MRTAFERLWRFPGSPRTYGLYVLLATLATASAAAAALTDQFWMLGLPLVFLLVWLTVIDFRATFFLMIACLPLSVEVELPGGLATDFVSEPLMWLLTLVSVVWFARHWRGADAGFFVHPITLALFAHLAWISVTVVTAQLPVVSLKFLLAKGWYVVVFYALAYRLLDNRKAFLALIWSFFIPLAVTVIIVLARHAAVGFAFDGTNYVMGPFYRNHVIYACVQAVFLPFLWYGTYFYRRWSAPWWVLTSGIVLLLVGINFAYTRAAYVALLAAVGLYWVIRWRLMKLVLVLGFALMMSFYALLSRGDNWLLFAPDYERTVTHSRFDNLLEATTKLEDISIMERVYRWVAASYMIQDKPLTGFGPGSFYFFYQKYTVSSFKTYVSKNPERSGLHNYYLMTTVEQGLPGLLFFLLMVSTVLLYGEYRYHRTPDVDNRRMLLAALLSFALINLLMLMNDFVETDKIGSFFFICMALIVRVFR